MILVQLFHGMLTCSFESVLFAYSSHFRGFFLFVILTSLSLLVIVKRLTSALFLCTSKIFIKCADALQSVNMSVACHNCDTCTVFSMTLV